MIITTTLLGTTAILSGAANISLLHELSKTKAQTDEMIEALNRAHLIATLYVLKDPKNNFKKFKEETQMKLNLKGNLSNRTKVIGGLTIIGALVTGISMFVDAKQIESIEAADESASAVERVVDAIEEIASAVADRAEEATDTVID